MKSETAEEKISRLEKEVASLRALKGNPESFSVREEMYKDHHVLVFQGPVTRPFTLGVGKLKTLKACMTEVERFLARHDSAPPSQRETLDERI